MHGIECPNCTYGGSEVKDSRKSPKANSVRRRRVCVACGHRFSTMEFLIEDVQRSAIDQAKVNALIAAARKIVELE